MGWHHGCGQVCAFQVSVKTLFENHSKLSHFSICRKKILKSRQILSKCQTVERRLGIYAGNNQNKTFVSNINMTNFWLVKIQNVTFLVILKQCESPHFHFD